jgi:hypothetical protein
MRRALGRPKKERNNTNDEPKTATHYQGTFQLYCAQIVRNLVTIRGLARVKQLLMERYLKVL